MKNEDPITTTTTTAAPNIGSKYVDYEPIYYDDMEEWKNSLRHINISDDDMAWAVYVREQMLLMSDTDDKV